MDGGLHTLTACFGHHGSVGRQLNTMVHRWHTTTTLTKCVVVWCMVLWVLFQVPTTTHFNNMCYCMVLWVLFRVPTTTHFNQMCCCMVLCVLFRVPTTTHFNQMCCCLVLLCVTYEHCPITIPQYVVNMLRFVIYVQWMLEINSILFYSILWDNAFYTLTSPHISYNLPHYLLVSLFIITFMIMDS